METFSALQAFCAGNSPVAGEFPTQRPVMPSFDVFFDLHPNKWWANNGDAGDLRRHLAHYDVIVRDKLWDIFTRLMTFSSYNSNNMVDDDLATQGARASAAISLT